MNAEKFKIKLMEQQIFDELKDSALTGCNYLKNKYKGLDIDYSVIYRKIINYQIKKYGNSITIGEKKITSRSREELNKLEEYRKNRKVRFRNYENKENYIINN